MEQYDGDYQLISEKISRSLEQIKQKWNLDLNPEFNESPIEWGGIRIY